MYFVTVHLHLESDYLGTVISTFPFWLTFFHRRWVCNPLRNVVAINDRLDGMKTICRVIDNNTNSH